MKRETIKTQRIEWILPLSVLVLAALVRVLYLVSYHNSLDWEWLTVDNWYHHNWAVRLASGDIWGGTTYFRAPFYVYCLVKW